MVGTRFRVLAIVVLCSGGSQAVDRWEVDNAFITLQGGQPVVAQRLPYLVYCMLPRPPLCMVLYDYVSQWILFLGLVLDLP